MAKTTPDADGIRAYLASLPPEARGAVGRLRALIRAAAPGAVESRSYGILGYKIDGRAFIYCAGWKAHVSLYPVTAAMRRDHADAIAPFQVSKGTLRFPLDAPLPLGLIKRLLKTRVGEKRSAVPIRGHRRS
jgi:uncharacterized protein YdhG (YjbR/CyaY superfamily)